MAMGWTVRAALGAAVAAVAGSLHAAGTDTQRIHGYDAQTLLGDGTGVIVGIVDSGIDINHPALTGTVSSGLPRFVAQQNFVTTEPGNSGDDVFGHGTAVAGQILSRDATFSGVATDARYINARVLDSTNSFSTDAWVVNGTGFAIANGANLLNLSLGYFNSNTSGNSLLSLMADYISFGRRIPLTISAGNAGNSGNPRPQGPGDAFNVFSLGATSLASNYGRIVSYSSYGPTGDGRNKPDIAAPGDQVTTANDDWETQSDFNVWSGTSFAAPNMAGILAAQMEYGMTHSLSIDPLVLKATTMNSAEKIQDRNGAAWQPGFFNTTGGMLTAIRPLNDSAGVGQVDGLKLFQQYSPGEKPPGPVEPIGWDLGSISNADTTDYILGELLPGSSLTATLAWYRHVGWTDNNGNQRIDSADAFGLTEALENLNLSIFRDGSLIARSVSSVANLEHLYLTGLLAGFYTVQVSRVTGVAGSEEFALAWFGTPVPEPLSTTLACGVVLLLSRQRRRAAR